MAYYSTNDFKSGLKVMLDGNPCSIMENEYVKPGKGQAFNRVKLRNLRSGKVLEKTFKSGDSLEAADIVEVEMEYLYNDGEMWNFMDPVSFEQIAADKNQVQRTPDRKQHEPEREGHAHIRRTACSAKIGLGVERNAADHQRNRQQHHDRQTIGPQRNAQRRCPAARQIHDGGT